MIYVLGAILSSAIVSVIYKLGNRKPTDVYQVSFFNSLVAMSFSLLLADKLLLLASVQTPAGPLIPLGLINGGLILFSGLAMQWSIIRNGAAMSATFNKLGVVIPTLLSILLFAERPRLNQSLGIVLSLIAITVIYFRKESGTSLNSPLMLAGTFIFGGLVDFLSKVFENYGKNEQEQLYLLLSFLVALVLTLVILIRRRATFSPRSMLVGMLAGIPLQLNFIFMIRALRVLPGYLVFPLSSAGVILMVQLINGLFFKEPLSTRQKLASGIIVLAVILLNI